MSIPTNGFVFAQVDNDQQQIMSFRTTMRIDAPVMCTQLTVSGTEGSLAAPYGGIYNIINQRYNDRPAWKKGGMFISFVDNQGHGTWLFGDKPGVDSGVAYARHPYPTLIPPSQDYFVLSSGGGGWVASSSSFSVICSNDHIGTQHFYHAEPSTGGSTILVPPWMDIDTDEKLQKCQQKEKDLLSKWSEHLDVIPKMPKLCALSYYDHGYQDWIALKSPESSSSIWFGSAMKLDFNVDKVYIVASGEHLYDIGWRLTVISPEDNENRYPLLSLKGDLSVPLEYNEHFYQNHPSLEPNGKQKPKPVVLDINTSTKMRNINGYSALSNMTVGQWAWVFAYPKPIKRDRHAVSGYAKRDTEPKGYVVSISGISSLSSQSTTTIIARWHSTDRGRVLKRRPLDAIVSTARFTLNHLQQEVVQMEIYGRNNTYGVDMDVISVIPMNETAIDYIRRYLDDHEGMYGISSCFMYHSGTSLPEPFIYAAEIACVLKGTKPVAMVQITSPSEDQTVYPFVRELCEHIVTMRAMLGPEQFPVDWRVFKYTYPATGVDHETLMVYRTTRVNLLNAMRPDGDVAQALHILPFPTNDDAQQREKDLREQLFLSYWNGKMLGYPDNMIEVYIRDFNTELPQAARNEEIQRGRTAVDAFFRASGLSPVVMREGLDEAVDSNFWETLPSVVSHRARTLIPTAPASAHDDTCATQE